MSRKFPFRTPLLLLSVLLVWSTWSCKDKEPLLRITPLQGGVFFVNEGNFQGGNARVDFWYRDSLKGYEEVFYLINALPLGDVAQSMRIVDDRAYIVVNNSGKVEVVNLADFESVCTIQGLTSPRFFQELGDGRAYVTDLYADKIHVVDLASCTWQRSIRTGGWTEELILHNGLVYVAQAGTDQVLVIDPVTDVLTDSIPVGREPVSIVVDRNDKLWVLCSGGLGEAKPELVRVNPVSRTAELTLQFGSFQENPSELKITADGDSLYFLNGGLYRMDIADGALPALPFVPSLSQNLYALDIDPVDGTIYLGDAGDFVSKGNVMQISPATGATLRTLPAGVIPGSFAFN